MIQEIASLKNNFLFQASLGSKELFHSNMLAWILEQQNEQGEFEAFRLFIKEIANLEIPKIYNKEELRVEREESNIDLILKWLDGSSFNHLFIENKMKSIPTTEQLEKYNQTIQGYSKGNEDPDRGSNSRRFILTPLSSNLNYTSWENITYEEQILNFLNKISTCNFLYSEVTNVHLVIQKYIDFIQQLLVLLKHFHLGKEQSNQFLERKYDFYSSPEIGSVRDIRLHDLILKLAHERLAEHLKHAAIENGITYRRIDTAFSNSTGMTTMDMALDETSGINIGIQLQGNQFRYYISSNNKPLNEKFAVELFHRRLWYIDIETGQPLLGKGTRKSVYRALGLKDESGERTFCEYNKGEFIYLYKNLMDLPSGKPTVSDVIQLFIQSFKHYLKHREEFVSLVSQV